MDANCSFWSDENQTVIFSILAAAIQPFGLLLFVYFGFYLFLFRWDVIKIFYQNINKNCFINCLFILISGHKFVLVPEKTYSLNEDMQEIPEVDNLYPVQPRLWPVEIYPWGLD